MKIVSLLSILALLVACDPGPPTSDQIQNKQNEQLATQAAQSVGMPAIANFQEKRVLKQIYELRDKEISTITYIVDFNGKLHKLCDSIGYGIPMAAQFSNPEKLQYSANHGYYTTPQAEPNGLFMPSSTEATWVLCLNPGTKDTTPVYSEPPLIVSTFPMPGVIQ